MAGMNDKGMGKQQAEQLGLPEGIAIRSPFPFAGVNLNDDRIAIDDKEFYYLENYLKIGEGYMRTVWDHGTALYTAAGNTILKFHWFNIGPTYYCAVFFSDGTAIQVSTTGVTTTISSVAGTFYNGNGVTPSCAQWGSQYLLISSNISYNGYWVWDGTVLYNAGTISPTIQINGGGSGYSSPPTVTAFGGAGSGISVTPVVTNGSITSLTINNPGSGYVPGNVVQFAFSGGGTDTSPQLTANLASNFIQAINVLTAGTNYVTAPTVAFSGGGGGSGAAATTSVSGGQVISITVTTGGSGYTSAPTIQLNPVGTGASGTATLSGTAVYSIAVNSGGSGYSNAPVVILTGGGGSGAAATATLSGSQVYSIAVTSGGSGYSSPPTVTLSTGSGATAAAYLNAGKVNSVTVVNAGTNFTAVPTVSFQGGGGAGATGTVVLSGGSTGTISSVTITSGGSGYTTAPAVVVSPGQNNAAYAVATLMPFGVSGYSIETFNNRVWLVNTYSASANVHTGGVMLISAPNSLSDFAASDAGDIYISNEPFLRVQYNSLRQAQGYLYTFSDSAVDVISNVQVSASTNATSFNYQNVDPQTGAAWRDSLAYFGLSVIFANGEGAFGLYGGAVKEISRKLLRLFDNALFPPTVGAVSPSAAVANIHTLKVYLLNMTVIDPTTGQTRTVMVSWDEKNWYILSQSVSLTFIGTLAQNSSYSAWGTDGTHLYPLFTTPSASLVKKFSTKLYGADQFAVISQGWGLWMMTADLSAAQSGVTMTATYDTESGSYATEVSPLNFAGLPVLATEPGNQYSLFMGCTATSYSVDYVLKHFTMGYVKVFGGYGQPPFLAGD